MNLYEIKALKAHEKIKELANKTAVTLSHTFAGNTKRDTYFTANPTELVDNLFIKVGAGYQQYVGSAWEDATAVVADLSGIESELSNIATEVTELAYITQKYTVDSWQKVQDIVRAGLASKAFKIGDQFVANYNSSPFTWDIIGIDHDKPTDASKTHSLTLQAHDCIMNCQFDAPELLYFAEAELAAGSYYFYNSYNTKNYSFTTTIAIPLGGSIEVSAWGASENPTQVKTYNASNVLLETLTVTEAATGTLLTCNDLRRVRYGSSNYIESNIKQWLNSAETTFTWTKKSKYSKPSSGAPYSGGGFLKLLDQELVAVLGAVDKQVAKNTKTDGGGQDLFSDKVFLLSPKEVFGTNEGTILGENAYAWYSALAGAATNSALAGRIKYLSGSARIWWLRSPVVGTSYFPRTVITTGEVYSYVSAGIAFGLAPACCIV